MRLLHELGYRHVRHYHGGLRDWRDAGGPLAGEDPAHGDGPRPLPPTIAAPRAAHDGAASGRRAVPAPDERRLVALPRTARERSHALASRAVDAIEGWSTRTLLLVWLAMVLGCALAYWLSGLVPGEGVLAGGERVPVSASGLLTAVYFSFVTATSVGYGDVVPVGALRFLAVAEAVAGLLAFGAVVSKFVSRRQDELVREIHRTTFDDRLDRVQTNLHLLVSELQAVSALCRDTPTPGVHVAVRLESAAQLFLGELRTVHDLLYRPVGAVAESVLEALLVGLAMTLRELADVRDCLGPSGGPSPMLLATLQQMARLAEEICGNCVPRTYAPSLTRWMDDVQATAQRLR